MFSFRDFSLIIQHIGKVVTSIEDGFFDLLEDMTDPQSIIPPNGYSFNEQKYMTLLNNHQSSYSQHSQGGLPNVFDSYSSPQRPQKTLVPGPAYLAFANVPLKFGAQRKTIFDATLKELIREAKKKNPSLFNPRYDPVPEDKSQIPNYFFTLKNQQLQNYQMTPQQFQQQQSGGFVQQIQNSNYYPQDPNTLANYQPTNQLPYQNIKAHSHSFPVQPATQNPFIQFRQNNKYDSKHTNKFSKKQNIYSESTDFYTPSNQYTLPVETPVQFSPKTFSITPLLHKELQYTKNNSKILKNSSKILSPNELRKDNKNQRKTENSPNIKKINLTKSKTEKHKHTLLRPISDPRNMNKSVSAITKYKYDEFKPSPKDWSIN